MARPATAAVRLLTGEREPVRLATTANIALQGLQTIDGVAAEVGDRVLVKNQADASQNGIYTASGGQWFRAADARTARTLQKGTTVHVQQGAVSADCVYAFETLNPVIGTDAITLAFYLSDDTLGDAAAAATTASSSAADALASKTAAAASATSAGNSATAAAGSASAADGSAAAAATSATNAGASASAASGSASGAATSATNAGNSATAAAGSATAAGTSATNAGTSATNAATSAAAAASSVAALAYTFSATITDADPGNGALRLNNATAASATAAFVDNLDAGGATVTGILDTFDDSTNSIKGQLTLRSKASAAISYVYSVTGSVVDGGGYRKLTLSYVSGTGTLPTTAGGVWLMFDRAGDKGVDGSGAGDFTGPASSVVDNIVTFAGTTGKAGKDSGVAVSSLAPKSNATLTGTPAAPTAAPGTNTTQIATTGFVQAAIDVVLGGVSATFDTLSEIATDLGLKLVKSANLSDVANVAAARSNLGLVGASEDLIRADRFLPAGTNGGQIGLRYLSTNAQPILYIALDAATAETFFIQWIPRRRYNGGTITAAPEWTAESGSGTFQLDVSAAFVRNDDPLDVAFGVAQTSNDTLLSIGDHHEGPPTAAIVPAGTWSRGAAVWLKCTRNVATDTLSADAQVYCLKITYTTDQAIDI